MLYYSTSNKEKIRVARLFLDEYDISFEEKPIGFIEIQSDSVEEIAKHKAKQAFTIIQKPLFVIDSGWSITALNGFPGPYLRYTNKWFTTDKYLKLMEKERNKEVILKEVLCYIDENDIKIFTGEIKGRILENPIGSGTVWEQIVTMLPNNKSMAQCKAENIKPFESNKLWPDFAKWYTNQILKKTT